MKRKKIDKKIINKVIEEEVKEEEEYENAVYLAHKKIKKIKDTDKRKIYQKLSYHLSYKGFSYDVIKKAIKEVIGE